MWQGPPDQGWERGDPGPRGYDVLRIAAVSSDSVPMHRVTRGSKLLQHPRILEAPERMSERFDLPTFTDARHTLFRVLK